MKHKLLTLIMAAALLFPVLSVAGTASAVDVFGPCGGSAKNTDVCQSVGTPGRPGSNPIIGALKVAITIIAVIIGVAAVIVIILAGFSMVTSNGDSQEVAKARTNIIYALVGLAVAVLAQSIVAFVLNKL